MADRDQHRGRLIAIDGTRGKDVARADSALVTALNAADVECAVSRWDASGLFGELAAGALGNRHLSPRALSLVYAADLAFRLRWEVRPVLERGGVVIAAPYVDTAVAFGAAAGLDERWLRELLRFAPKPDLRGRSDERKPRRGWRPRLDRGYGEFAAALLQSSPRPISKKARRDAMAVLDRRGGRRVHRLSERGVAGLVRAVSGSSTAAMRRSRAPRRNGRR
jgi:dTMP kinase